MMNRSPDSGGNIVIRSHLHLVKDCGHNVMLTRGLAQECERLFLGAVTSWFFYLELFVCKTINGPLQHPELETILG